MHQSEKAWNTIVREHDFNSAGLVLLQNALHSLTRAGKCREIIDRDGPLISVTPPSTARGCIWSATSRNSTRAVGLPL
jgi:hypothetical protein